MGKEILDVGTGRCEGSQRKEGMATRVCTLLAWPERDLKSAFAISICKEQAEGT